MRMMMTSSPQATAEGTCAPPHSAAARIFLRKALAGRDERLHPSLPLSQEMMQDMDVSLPQEEIKECVRHSAARDDAERGMRALFLPRGKLV